MSQPNPQNHGLNVDVLTTTLDKAVNWAQRNSLWPMPMGISCCAIEMMSTVASRYDLARFGAEAMRFSPRQSDMMIVAGTLTNKMAPVVRRIYDQMLEPKYVIAMGTCLCTGGMFDSYSVVQGLDRVLPVDIYLPGCPPRPEALIDALRKLQSGVVERQSVRDQDREQYASKIDLGMVKTTLEPSREGTMILNMGPQHPATHGVFRVELEMDGETVVFKPALPKEWQSLTFKLMMRGNELTIKLDHDQVMVQSQAGNPGAVPVRVADRAVLVQPGTVEIV